MSAVTATDLVLRHGQQVALDTSTLDVPTGSVTALIGPNGSGKSTLLNAIAGLHEPASGTLRVFGPGGERARIAYVLQATKVNDVLPVTVREVVAMGRYGSTGPYRRLSAADKELVEDSVERMGLATLRDRHLHQLSGGQRQGVFVAQGLAQDHDILLLDEPLTGLDLVSARAIDDVIHGERERGCTVVITTHDLSEARVADHVLLLAGAVVACGPPGDVLTTENLATAYGTTLLHVDGHGLFVDDPAHRPTGRRHTHGERTIHVERSASDLHGDDDGPVPRRS
jgi:ABC-type Mn2+/Zn2+ transport system ATPase subunit